MEEKYLKVKWFTRDEYACVGEKQFFAREDTFQGNQATEDKTYAKRKNIWRVNTQTLKIMVG